MSRLTTRTEDGRAIIRLYTDPQNVKGLIDESSRKNREAENIGKLLKEQPPREKGQWELVEDDWNVYNCTVCNEWWQLENGTPAENNMNFCPHCGADMREGEQG